MTTEPPSVLGRTVTHPLQAHEVEVWQLTRDTDVRWHTQELQAVCPVTEQPDVYAATITYTGRRTLESKGLKLYLWRFRDLPLGCEELAGVIASQLADRLRLRVTVELVQQVRGGLTLTATASAHRALGDDVRAAGGIVSAPGRVTT